MSMFSFIIVNYNTKEAVKRCLNSVIKFSQSEEIEIIVIDNNSSDGSQEMIKDNFLTKVNYIFNTSNLGFSRACNQGASIARGDYLFFLNSDAYLVRDIIKDLEKIFEKNKKIAAISPVIKDCKLNLETRFCGSFPNFKNTIFKKDEKIIELELKKLIKDGNDIKKVDWISGVAFVIRRTAFFSVGGFDKNFFMYFEDVDICLRLKKLNYYCAIASSNIFLIHEKGLSLEGRDKIRENYYYQSQDYYFKKHYGNISMYILKFFRFFYLILFK